METHKRALPRIQCHGPFFVAAFRDQIGDLAFLPRWRAGEVTQPLFAEKFNFTPRPVLPALRYPS